MKKRIILTLALLTLVVIFANAQYYPESDFSVTRNNDGTSVTITAYTRTSRTVNIPPTYRELSVTMIGDRAFVEKNLTNVTIPNSVIHIGVFAFARNQLTCITIPNSVTHIGDSVFHNNRIRSVTIGSNVTIGSHFPNNFALFYNSNGRKAGIYDYNERTRTWTWLEW